MKMAQQTIAEVLESIARKHFHIKTLEAQRSDALDFHEVSVWGVKAALQAAFEAGKAAAEQENAK